MNNKNILRMFLLFGVCTSLLSLASCQGIKGEKGEEGIPGSDGKPGIDGENGKDGNSWLVGDGVPNGSLGEEGDLYLDTLTYDIYQKKDGLRVKIGNNKGEDGEDGTPGKDGEDGEDGIDGSDGSKGETGDTARSNTILPCENGYITVNKGSAIVGEEITFSFIGDIVGEKTYGLSSLKLNNIDRLRDVNIKTQSITIPMIEKGFVVQATFDISDTSTKDDVENKMENASEGEIVNLVSENDKPISLDKEVKVKRESN